MTDDRQERIRRRAHEIWEQAGRPEGSHMEHWDQATAEIDGEKQPKSKAAPKKAAASKAAAVPKAAVAKTAKPKPAPKAAPKSAKAPAKPKAKS
ncbi:MULTISPECIES: DUF2934 domain-containing protein [unclassified Mesorhizobium]|uniref:DUF2934 domain-containing protein n=1 Tax=unclassified Mesorhizobium TaxID=325217 RepID=UPI000BAE8068|nr:MULTISPECIES: DUF2934 domain-containing protein [unclassified Mesorhizobium]TGT60949.1 DUF2934 domain-containing protein [Mesorhizobium sp. M00.F.Ca.ET.170.01.1.1]AZO08715.1 DUF2934 domain-containing protein [Mesorhizobium sp. M3A.F.Ca.ET.080.04.2.1]PBB84134.1 hypothetical protein CK216_25535 [Mesorhizobium sp. WSM3876]RWB72160.1 MAG: DUF2934 domain-containing protein [Mesorhizobium sp.]RWB83634.1 MAG: DUF2934 domain-containing protein [Mesorhizobium sp.]